ncbi:putative necrosis-inducing factor domain containing protein, partial [Naviculisporaceae sp. PSN 640]
PPQLTITLSASSSPNGTNHTNSTNSTTHHPGNGAGNGTLWYYCDGGPTINATSAGSPLIRDCRALIADIETHEWSYKWISCSQHALVSNGTCVFGIETVPDNICLPFTTLETGNGDIVEWIRDSIARWGELDKGEEGRVGSWGESRCHNIGWWRDDYMRVKWGLYHS